SHSGVEIGADGPSQMALEDLAMIRAVHASTVLYPADATSTAALVQRMAETSGISYLRTTRGAYPVLYSASEQFPVGGSKLLRSSGNDDVTLVGAGVTLHEALKAADILDADGIHARVIDCYSIKPIDAETLLTAAGEFPSYTVGEKVATRKAYGDALAALGGIDPAVVALDGEVSNSTHSDEFAKAFPGRFFEMYIAEQQLIAAATGLSIRGYKAFASTFAAFLTRAYDFIRMGSITGADLRLCGSHSGVEIGADGPSQMALEDLAMIRAVHASTVLYPADATSTAALVQRMAETSGISYLRTTRGTYPVLYSASEQFPVGGSKLLRSSGNDDVTLVGAGVTLHEALKAADILDADGIQARVIDCYSIK
uniref:transketolase C-terminal domain-containing protein n=1 Tax=Arthrobacter sp. I3 TaxID=218158 RepID=UPI0023B8134D